MMLYHGTTRRRAERVCREGFHPRKPSRRVWFAESRDYALRRAKTQARRRHDRPVVLVCDVDLNQMRAALGPKSVMQRNRVVAINGLVPVSVLRTFPGKDVPTTRRELAAWVNRLLGLKAYKGVGWSHAGIDRLARWVAHRLTSQPHSRLRPVELLDVARQWLPEYFEGVEVEPRRLKAVRRVGAIHVKAGEPQRQPDEREEEALDCLNASNPRRRARGLSLLAEMDDPDLFDWCVMFLGDEARCVRVGALTAMLRCDEIDPAILVPLARSKDKSIRAGALAALAHHCGRDALRWFERGLKDPEPCVRIRTAAQLSRLDPAEHRALFELALHDPNLEVARAARSLTEGQGYGPPKW